MLINPFTLLNCLRFEEEGGGGGNTPATEPTNDEERMDEKVTYTRADLAEKFQAREIRGKKQGQREFEESLASEFGMSLSEAKELVKKQKEQQDAEKSEAQKAREAAEQEKAAAATEREQAQRERHSLKVERALMVAGVEPAKVERIAKMVTVEVGAEDEAITEAVEEIKQEFPAVFGSSEPNGLKPVDSNSTNSRGPKKLTPTTAWEFGKERAAKFNPQTKAQ